MILTGNEDLRVRRTIDSIKSVFEQMICEMDYSRIRVTELCSRAMINKKTFYVYYHTLDDLLDEIQSEYSSEYIEHIKDYKLPDELDKVNREFFLFSEEKGLAYEKITCAGNEIYRYIRGGMIKKVNTAGWSGSKKYGALPGYQQTMLMNFINNSVLGIYRQWIEEGKQQSVEEITEITNRLVLGGVKGFFG
ncbi:MAG: TetR/AcrR family transcriptional regulator [Oscillospiraceae bacterium]|nr:TetR/AcrR family transcriptional regulator [Oscillospiraceae bacterium]